MSELAFELSGKQEGTSIILVPGGLSGWISWKPHAEILSKNFKVIRVQLLNMTAAEKHQAPEPGYSLHSRERSPQKHIRQAWISKNKLSWMVTWRRGVVGFALNYPECIATLTLIEPAAYWVARGYGQFEREMREFAQLIQSFHDPPSEEDLTRFLKINGLVPPGVEPKNMARWPFGIN